MNVVILGEYVNLCLAAQSSIINTLVAFSMVLPSDRPIGSEKGWDKKKTKDQEPKIRMRYGNGETRAEALCRFASCTLVFPVPEEFWIPVFAGMVYRRLFAGPFLGVAADDA